MEEKLKQIDSAKALLIGIGLAALYYFMIYNDGTALEMAIAQNQGLVSQKSAEIETMKRTLVDAERHKEVSKKIGEELELVLRAVPRNYNSVELMKLISTEAKAVGANLVGVSGSDGVPTEALPDFVPITVTVSLNGTFNQMMMFLSNLTKTSKVILTKSIAMSASAVPGAASPIVTFSASFESYRFKTDEKGGR